MRLRRPPTEMQPRRVTFNDIVIVHFQHRWSDREYRAARKGLWMHYAADRCRFNRYVKEFDKRYGHIFSDIHRERMRTLIDRYLLTDDFVKTSIDDATIPPRTLLCTSEH